MTWIKICGITNLEDAQLAVDAGADALGFVFYKKSPRRVDVETARTIVAQLPERVEKVGVFVEDSSDQQFEIYNTVHLTAIQQHLDLEMSSPPGGNKATGLNCFWRRPKLYKVLSAPWILAEEGRLNGMIASFSVWGDNIPEEARQIIPDLFGTFFLDAGTATQPGGTGTTFDWKKAMPLVDSMRQKLKVVVAGGLNPGNVTEAIHTLHPWGVDVSSGTEAKPGKKDPQKVRAFVQAVRSADKAA